MKHLPHVVFSIALAAAGLALLKPPTPGPIDASGPELVDPKVARPFPEAMQLSSYARNLLIEEVIDGRRSLVSAATLFRELDLRNGQVWDRPWIRLAEGTCRLPGRTPAERLCRQVEIRLRETLGQDPGRRDAVLARLEGEFRDAHRVDGDICLPGPETLESVEHLLARARASMTDRQRRHLYDGLRRHGLAPEF
jgi:hypothetical protein